MLIKYFEVDKFYGYILNYFICKIYTTMSELTNIDYKKILEFYNKPIPKSKRFLRMQAVKIIVSKLCRCIKKVDKKKVINQHTITNVHEHVESFKSFLQIL